MGEVAVSGRAARRVHLCRTCRRMDREHLNSFFKYVFFVYHATAVAVISNQTFIDCFMNYFWMARQACGVVRFWEVRFLRVSNGTLLSNILNIYDYEGREETERV